MSAPIRRLLAGVALILTILFGQDVWGAVTVGGRLDPALQAAHGPVTAIVVLDFTPERFHNERLGQYGTFAGRAGSVSRIRLRNVSPENLAALARLPWVARVEAGK